MPETPDFKQIAEDIVDDFDAHSSEISAVYYLGPQIVEQLRQVWNARGAADIVKVEAELYADGTSRPGLTKMLDLALRTLDR